MTSTTHHIAEQFREQQEFFHSGATRSIEARKEQLKRLTKAMTAYEGRLLEALYADLHKPATEAYLGELSLVHEELSHALKHLARWMRPEKVRMPLVQSPGTSFVQAEPYGTVGVIAPWNYPVMLLLSPAVGALAAGNTVMLKPSELTPETSATVAKMVKEYVDPAWMTVVEGGVETAQALLAEPLDYLFFTGSTAVGKIVMRAAAEHLTPVTLELGGKSPAIIDRRCDLDTAVKRIAWGKFFNLGQTCVAPDYLLVPQERKEEVFSLMRKHLREMYGGDPKQSPDLARIVNTRHFDRLNALLTGNIVIGGQSDEAELYIAPTIISVEDPTQHPSMQEEIFGPILPVIGYETLAEAIAFVNERPKPLALYVFSNSRRHQQQVLEQTSSGGVCLNDAVVQFGSADLPVGGVGASGLGRYHGKASFDTFSHHKSVMKRSFLIDIPFRYPPYRSPLELLKGAMKLFG